MLQSGWSLFCGYLQNVCVCLTLLLNSFMIYLIVEKSPKKIGKYKYLMLYISIFEIFYALLATVTKPFVHSYASRVIVIVVAKNSWFGRDFTKVLNSCICGFYGCSVTILAIHFMYRYGSLDKKDIWDYFELKVEDIVYTGPYYYPEDKNGLGDIEPLACFGMFVLWFVIGSSSVVVIYYGFRCYITMKKLLGHSTSRFTQGLQHQLFKALVWQTIIPLIMLYIPCSIVFICPLLQINIGNSSAFITVSVAVYPAIDTLPNIFIIKNYNRATLDLLCCTRCRNKNSSTATKTNSAMVSHAGISETTT
ncbi:CRE-STR-181 protein [Caenorhabditis remanei]|uniref:CRE-STR-181 protein n=1 Tax=Caenorhabditis remanei TaxID=31234 RepID=E3LNQ8_CAERE|nr:CRE-STR-181 protein [Caenorhabditis remanei]